MLHYVYYLDDCLAYKSSKGVFAIIFVLIHLDHVFMKMNVTLSARQ